MAKRLQIVPGPMNTAGMAAGIGDASLARKMGRFVGKHKVLSGSLAMIGPLLLDMILNQSNTGAELDMQSRLMDEQGAAMADPSAYFYEAMLPEATDRRRQAENALMRQLSGGVMGPALARGERLT